MKKAIILILAATALLSGCRKAPDPIFHDYYVCIKNEAGAGSSIVNEHSNQFIDTYYVYLVSAILDTPLTVNYEIIPGDGLKEGVDYELLSQKKSVTIARGISKAPIRINFLRHDIDPTKDNTITIQLTDCDNSKVSIGYPGPKHYLSSHVITKVVDD